MEDIIYTRREIAEKYKVHINTVDNWIKDGLQVQKINRSVRIKESDLNKFISEGKA